MMRMPAEFARHERTVMCWPARHELYGQRLGDAYLAHASVARTISGFEPVTMIANHQDVERDRKSTRLNSSHVSESRMPSSA